MAFLTRLMATVLPIALFCLMTGAAGAQTGLGATGAATAPDPAPGDLAAAIREAAQNGASVIVLDSSGRIVTTSPAGPSGQTAASGGGTAGGKPAGGSMLMSAQSRMDQFRLALSDRLAALPSSVNEVIYILRATSPDGRIMTFVSVVFWTALLLLLGRLATIEIFGKRLMRRWVVSKIEESPQGYLEKMPFLVFRFFVGIGGTLFALIIVYPIGRLAIEHVSDDDAVEFAFTAVLATFFFARTVSDVWRMILSPFLSQYRIPHLSDRDAKRLYRWASAIATFDIAAVMFSTWIQEYGLNYNVYAIVAGGLALIGALGNVLLILFNARALSSAIRHGKAPFQVPRTTRFLSFIWAPVLIGFILLSWFRLAFNLAMELPVTVPPVAGTYGVVLSVLVVYGLINYAIERFFLRAGEVARLREEHEAAEAAEADTSVVDAQAKAMTTYQDLARRIAGILAFCTGGYALLALWAPRDSKLMQETLSTRFLDIVTVLFIGYVVYHVFRIWIDNRIAEEAPDVPEGELGDEGGATGASRLATLLPLFRGTILAVVLIAVALIVLMELGINVSPLFAGAGVVGLAIGFGAQTLVRDIFSGAFFLIDDAFRKGEYVDIGDVKGTVEKISVRSFQLRHHLGALNTIPFGEIKVLTNYSRDWVIMKLPLRVTYDTDVEKVRKLIKKLGQELLTDPVIGDNFIQPLKSQGVIEMQDNAMIIRVKFMTKPGDQWLVRKRVYQDIRELFAREGIKFAHREVTVRLADGDPADLTPAQREAVAGAAQAIADGEDFDDMPPGGDDR